QLSRKLATEGTKISTSASMTNDTIRTSRRRESDPLNGRLNAERRFRNGRNLPPTATCILAGQLRFWISGNDFSRTDQENARASWYFFRKASACNRNRQRAC